MIDLKNPESKKGAMAALTLLLQSRHTEITRISGDNKGGSKPSGLIMPRNISEAEAMEPEDQEAEQKRLDRAKDVFSNDGKEKAVADIKQGVQDKRDQAEAERLAKLRAKEAELIAIKEKAAKMNNLPWGNIQLFGEDLVRAIGSQIKIARNKEQTFRKPNASYAGTKLLAPVFTSVEKLEKPVINVYYDKSGSVPKAGLDIANEALAKLDTFRKKGLCNFKIFYFAEKVSADETQVGSGTTAFPEILEHLRLTRAQNAIIITDDDFDSQTDFDVLQPLTIKGCVWWFWHEGYRSKKAMTFLEGKRGEFQYKFTKAK